MACKNASRGLVFSPPLNERVNHFNRFAAETEHVKFFANESGIEGK